MMELFHLAFLALCFYVPFITMSIFKQPPSKKPGPQAPVYITPHSVIKTEKKRKKQQKQAECRVEEKKKQERVVTNKLQEDAIQCLISLGMKKVAAKKKVENMFQAKNYKSIESFLFDAYKVS